MLVQKCCDDGFLFVVCLPRSSLGPKRFVNLHEGVSILPGTSSEVMQFGVQLSSEILFGLIPYFFEILLMLPSNMHLGFRYVS
jgi:hypothetical protein